VYCSAYKTGVAQGLIRLAKEEKEEEKRKAVVHEQKLLEQMRKDEDEEIQRRLERLKDPGNAEAEEHMPKVEVLDDEINLGDPPPKDSGNVKADEVEPAVESTKVKLEEVEDEDQPQLYDFVDAAFPADADAHGGDGIYGDMLATADFDDSDSDDNLLDLDSAEPRVKQRSLSPLISMPPPPPPLLAKEETVEEEESQWGSVNQLVAFRETSVAVGEE
jgi:hypothetical protein